MRDEIDNIIQFWSECHGVEFTAKAGEHLAQLVEEKFTSTKTAHGVEQICPDCEGNGWYISKDIAGEHKEWCDDCDGTGKLHHA